MVRLPPSGLASGCRGRAYRCVRFAAIRKHQSCIGSPAAGTAPPASLNIEKLRGLTAAQLAQHLGEPDFVRPEPPAMVWQYRGSECVLDIFLYRGADEFRVAYAETRDRGPVRVSQPDCYADLMASRVRPL
jgi:hypothetical protein